MRELLQNEYAMTLRIPWIPPMSILCLSRQKTHGISCRYRTRRVFHQAWLEDTASSLVEHDDSHGDMTYRVDDQESEATRQLFRLLSTARNKRTRVAWTKGTCYLAVSRPAQSHTQAYDAARHREQGYHARTVKTVVRATRARPRTCCTIPRNTSHTDDFTVTKDSGGWVGFSRLESEE